MPTTQASTGSVQPATPGQVLPVVLPPPAGSNGSVYQNGQALNNQAVAKQTSINGTAGGGSKKRKSKRRGSKRKGTKRRGSKRKGTKRRGSKRRTRKGGQIAVAVPPVSYPEQGTGNQTIAGVTTDATKVGTTGAQNSSFDACLGQGPSCTANAMQKGGCGGDGMCGLTNQSGGRKRKTKRRRRGGAMKWGCMSGGKKWK